jgi:hypothetical protein
MFVKELDVVHCDVGLNMFSNGTSCTDYWEAMTVRSIFGEACDQAGCDAPCLPSTRCVGDALTIVRNEVCFFA